jgi:hypothetical protein
MLAFLQGKDLYVDMYGMYSFVPLFREAKFCGVPPCVFGKLGCAAGEKRLRNTGLEPRLRDVELCFQYTLRLCFMTVKLPLCLIKHYAMKTSLCLIKHNSNFNITYSCVYKGRSEYL